MDIKQALKEQIKQLKTELAKNEKALAALEGEKAPPKAKAANGVATTSGSKRSTASSAGAADGTSLPDRIIAELATRDEQTADAIAEGLGASIQQVRTTCSRLAREGRITSVKNGRTVRYLSVKSEVPAVNPFESEAN